MADTGIKIAGTSANNSAVGAHAWSGTGNTVASENTRATVSLDSGFVSHYLFLTNFSFAVPTAATIDGVLVQIERSRSVGASIADNSIRLIIGGSVTGTDNALAANWPGSDTDQNYGGASDLWGATLTDTIINASDFGVAISAKGTGAAGTARVDYVRITVYYTEAVAGGGFKSCWATQSNILLAGGIS